MLVNNYFTTRYSNILNVIAGRNSKTQRSQKMTQINVNERSPP